MTSLIPLFINPSVLSYFYLQPFGERIYDGCAYTVQSSGYLVSPAAEFSAGMKNGKHYLNRRDSRLMIDSYGYSSSVIHNSHGIIFVYSHIYGIAKACQCFIHGIIDNLIYKMMQASACSRADIHTGTLSYRLETLQNLNLVSAILMVYGCVTKMLFTHLLITSTFPSFTLKILFISNLLFTKSSSPVQLIIVCMLPILFNR